MPIDDRYIDNNETIYFSESEYNSISAGTSLETKLSLRDIPELSGQSTIFINKIRFQVEGVCLSGSPGNSRGHMVCGIGPYGTSTVFDELEKYQQVKGWPLKMAKRFYYVPQNIVQIGLI